MSTPNLNLAFTGQTFLVDYIVSRHLVSDRSIRLSDKQDEALGDFIDALEVAERKATGRFPRTLRHRWVNTTPDDVEGFTGKCAITGQESNMLQRMTLISWTEVQA